MTNGTLLHCPNCYQTELDQFGTYRSFGSITPYGEVIVMRKGNHKTMIIATELTLVCDCGYSVHYSKGQLSVGDLPASYYERHSNYHRS